MIVALLLGQTGARLAPDLKSIAFALFIFALGFTGGPQFFANIGRVAGAMDLLSIVEIVSVLMLIMTRGVRAASRCGYRRRAAGGRRDGVGGDRHGFRSDLASSGFADAETARLQANIVTAYSVSYLFGLITIVLFTSQFAPLLLRVNLREEAERVWHKLGGDGALGEGQRMGAPALGGTGVSRRPGRGARRSERSNSATAPI